MNSVADRFWEQVDKRGSVHPTLKTPCWLWGGKKDGYGFGYFLIDKLKFPAHRVAYALSVDELPADWHTWRLRQRCGDKRCCNPDHLVLLGQWRLESNGNGDHPPLFRLKARPRRPPRPRKPRLGGVWRRVILARLEEVEQFYLADLLPDGYSRVQHRALCQAASTLYDQGRINKRRFRGSRDGPQLVIARQGIEPQRPSVRPNLRHRDPLDGAMLPLKAHEPDPDRHR